MKSYKDFSSIMSTFSSPTTSKPMSVVSVTLYLYLKPNVREIEVCLMNNMGFISKCNSNPMGSYDL